MRFFCTINNILYDRFKILIDGIELTDYNYCNDKIVFDMPLDQGEHVLKIIFYKNGRKIKIDEKNSLVRTNPNFLSFKKSGICLPYNVKFKIKKDAEVELQAIDKTNTVGNSEINYKLITETKHKGIIWLKQTQDFGILRKEGKKTILLNNSIGLIMCVLAEIICLLNCLTGNFMNYIVPCIYFLIATIFLLIRMLLWLDEWKMQIRKMETR